MLGCRIKRERKGGLNIERARAESVCRLYPAEVLEVLEEILGLGEPLLQVEELLLRHLDKVRTFAAVQS